MKCYVKVLVYNTTIIPYFVCLVKCFVIVNLWILPQEYTMEKLLKDNTSYLKLELSIEILFSVLFEKFTKSITLYDLC